MSATILRNYTLNIILIFLSCLIFSRCSNENTLPNDLKSIDSTWTKIEHALEVDTIGYKAVTAYVYYAGKKSKKEVAYLASKMREHPDWDKNEDLPSAYQLLEAWHYWDKGNDSMALTLFRSIKSDQIDIKLSAIQARAFYYYIENTLDTALQLYVQSYQIAKSQKHKSWLLRCANNLGTVYFDLREFGIASTYFTEAFGISQELNTQVPMLLNNIITCALVDSDGTEAIELYNKYSKLFVPENEYERHVYEINKVHYFWKIQQIDSFKYYLDRIDVSNAGETVNLMRDKQYLFYYAYQNDKTSFSKLFNKYKSKILESPNEYLIPWSDLLAYSISNNMPVLAYAELLQLYKKNKGLSNKKFISELNHLMYLLKKDNPIGKEWQIEHLNNELEIRKSSALTFQNDLKNQIKIHDLNNENNEIKLKLQLESATNQTYLVLIIGSVLILTLLIFGFVLYNKNKKITIQKLQLEIQNSRNINELNLNKKQFAERLISANQSINKKLEKISNKLKVSEFAKNPEIIQVRKELESISELKGEWTSEMEQIQSIDDIGFLFDHFKCIQNFNQTEQSLLAYLINGHKVKEIAALLDISQQHVRNTKTKIFKALSSENGSDIDIVNLLELRDKKVIIK